MSARETTVAERHMFRNGTPGSFLELQGGQGVSLTKEVPAPKSPPALGQISTLLCSHGRVKALTASQGVSTHTVLIVFH